MCFSVQHQQRYMGSLLGHYTNLIVISKLLLYCINLVVMKKCLFLNLVKDPIFGLIS